MTRLVILLSTLGLNKLGSRNFGNILFHDFSEILVYRSACFSDAFGSNILIESAAMIKGPTEQSLSGAREGREGEGIEMTFSYGSI